MSRAITLKQRITSQPRTKQQHLTTTNYLAVDNAVNDKKTERDRETLHELSPVRLAPQ